MDPHVYLDPNTIGIRLKMLNVVLRVNRIPNNVL